MLPTETHSADQRLCRYLLRAPLGEDRLRLLGDGRVRVQLKRRGVTARPTCSSSPWSSSRSWGRSRRNRRSIWSSATASSHRTHA